MDLDKKGDKVKLLKGKFHSQYFEDSKNVLDELNKISPSFCLAKWYNVSIHIPSGKTHSCYHPPSHAIPIEELQKNSSALHNTKYKKEQRQKMLQGERPEECSFCWDIEDQGNISDRAYRSRDVFDPELIPLAQIEEDPQPRYMEVNFNQACNLKCAYCSPHLSTEWYKEVKKFGGYELIGRTHNDPRWVDSLGIDNSPDNPYVKAFWDWFPEVYPTLKTFRMTGGEPLMDKNTFKVFEYVIQNPNPSLHLSITSNCCPPKGQWQTFMERLKEITDKNAIDHFMLFCSLDSWGEQAEYIRSGLDFEVLKQNIQQYLTESSKHSITFIITANILSLPNWMEYIRNIHSLRCNLNTDRQLVWFDTPMLHDPNWMSMKLASDDELKPLLASIEFMKANIETSHCRYKGFKDFEIDKVQRLYDWAKTPMNKEEKTIAMKNFDIYFKEHDRRRNTDIRKMFPELKNFIIECENLNAECR